MTTIDGDKMLDELERHQRICGALQPIEDGARSGIECTVCGLRMIRESAHSVPTIELKEVQIEYL
jgi:hypothetical protein